jgi:hypothetical protein
MMNMRKVFTSLVISFTATVWLMVGHSQAEAGHRLMYKFKPNQQWVKTDRYETHSEAMGFKTVSRHTTVVKYQVKPAKKTGWVALEGSIVSNTTQMDDQAPQDLGVLQGIKYTAIVHTTGDTRQIEVSGGDAAARLSAEAHKVSVFWFPELPEEALQLGDEFDWVQNMAIKDPSGMSITTATKWSFLLEEVDSGLAYFSIKSRSKTQTQSAMGGATMPSVNKGEGIFDLKEGMWVEWRLKGKMDMSSIPGMGEMKAFMINKMSMERR